MYFYSFSWPLLIMPPFFPPPIPCFKKWTGLCLSSLSLFSWSRRGRIDDIWNMMSEQYDGHDFTAKIWNLKLVWVVSRQLGLNCYCFNKKKKIFAMVWKLHHSLMGQDRLCFKPFMPEFIGWPNRSEGLSSQELPALFLHTILLISTFLFWTSSFPPWLNPAPSETLIRRKARHKILTFPIQTVLPEHFGKRKRKGKEVKKKKMEPWTICEIEFHRTAEPGGPSIGPCGGVWDGEQ